MIEADNGSLNIASLNTISDEAQIEKTRIEDDTSALNSGRCGNWTELVIFSVNMDVDLIKYFKILFLT